MRAAILLALVALLAPAAAGCGSSAPRVVVTPMTPEAETAFENGIDFVDDPSLLEGSWLEDWQSDIDHRVSLADAIVLVRITTLRTDTDLERHDTYRLIASVESVRFGDDVPSEITLIAREGEPGFGTLHGNDSRVLNQRFVLFLKWTQPTEGGSLVARWHLSPAGQRVIARANTLIELRRTSADERRRVIVHDHTTTEEDDEEE